ncbi:MAG: hypothetical protein L6Q97_05240 [Thermoanaerobaculia bacterium]|nr:hypothetical protein [Thermoanaerobaculia bacterium]
MSAREIRSSINKILDNTPDEEILEAYYQILLNLLRMQKHLTVAFDADNQPMSLEQLRNEVAKAGKRTASGRIIKHDEAKKQAESW